MSFRAEKNPDRFMDSDRNIVLKFKMVESDGLMFKLSGPDLEVEFFGRRGLGETPQKSASAQSGKVGPPITWTVGVLKVDGAIELHDAKSLIADALKDFKFGWGTPKHCDVEVYFSGGHPA